MVRNDFGHEKRNFVRRVEFACFLSRVGGEVAYEIFVDEAKNVVVLPPVHRNVFYQIYKVAYRPRARAGCVAELRQPCLKRREYAAENLLVRCVYKPLKG